MIYSRRNWVAAPKEDLPEAWRAVWTDLVTDPVNR
jgi:hypothetical protein